MASSPAATIAVNAPAAALRPGKPHDSPRSFRQRLLYAGIGSSSRELEDELMGSFKLKLFLWFALLALLPLAVAFYGYDSLAKRSETRRVDAGLQSSLRAAVAGYQGRLDAASAQAAQLAAEPRLQRALRGRDVATLRRVVARVPGASVTGRGLHVGSTVTPAGVRSVTVTDGGAELGRVSVRVPVDDRLLALLGTSLSPEDELVATRGGRVIAGRGRGQPLVALSVRPTGVQVASVSFRALATAPFTEPKGLALRRALAPVRDRRGGAQVRAGHPARARRLARADRDRHLPARTIDRADAAPPRRRCECARERASRANAWRSGAATSSPHLAQRLQRHGGAARAAARRARDRADPRPGRGRPVRRGARRDPRLDAAPAGRRRDGGRGDRRRRRPRARPRGRARRGSAIPRRPESASPSRSAPAHPTSGRS